MRREIVAVLAALATVGVLGACTTTVTPTGAPTAATSAPAASPSPAPSAATTSAPATPVTAGYDDAKAQWQAGATAISAQQGMYWQQAAKDLSLGESSDTGDTSGYPAAVTHLTELVSLPDAQQTPEQNAAYHADINALNAFFKTPGLYS